MSDRIHRLLLTTACLCASPLAAQAHDLRGVNAIHWHATDTWGFIVTLGLVGAALWISRRK